MKRPSCVVQIVGAGTDDVNGIYWQTEHTLNDYPCYSKSGTFHDNVEDEDCILIWRASNSTWYISLFHADENGQLSDSYMNYYQSSSLTTKKKKKDDVSTATPPESVWQLFNDGAIPPPIVTVVNVPSTNSKGKFVLDKAPHKELLQNKKMSDVQFHCKDGTILYAHKVMLCMASPYFSSLFEDNISLSDGIINVKYSSEVMKLMLKFMYLGKATKEDLKKDPTSILILAHQYQLDKLVEAAIIVATEMMDTKNMKTLLTCAHQYKLTSLLESCFQFIQKNLVEILTDEDFITLATENNDLWSDMRTYLLSKNKNAKKDDK